MTQSPKMSIKPRGPDFFHQGRRNPIQLRSAPHVKPVRVPRASPTMISLYVGTVLALGSLCLAAPPQACSDAMLPLNVAEMQGKWNIIAATAKLDIVFLYWKQVHFLWTEISIIGDHVNATSFYGSVGLTSVYPFKAVKTSQDESSITFTETASTGYGLKLSRSSPDSMIMIEYEHGQEVGIGLYSRSHEVSAENVEKFKHWTGCKNYTLFHEYKSLIDYASVCPEVLSLEESAEEPIEGRWPLVAKASSIPDIRYMARILYSARLDFSVSKKNYAIKEFQIIGGQEKCLNEVHPDREGKSIMDDCTTRVLVFKSRKDTLLLGVEKVCKIGSSATLYFSAKSGKVKKSEIEKFKQQALCYSVGQVYLVPNTQDSESHEDGHNHERVVSQA